MRSALVLLVGLLAFVPHARADVWGIKSCGPDPSLCPTPTGSSEPPTTLFSFPEGGGSVTDLGQVLVGATPLDVDGLAISSQLELRAFELVGSVPPPAGSSQLISIDSGTGSATRIGAALPGRDIRGAMFDAFDRFWAVDAESNELLRIDPATGALIGTPIALSLAGVPFDVDDRMDLAMRGRTEVVLVSLREFYRLDLSTGVLLLEFEDTAVEDLGIVPTYAGLAGRPDTNDVFVYDVVGDDDIFGFDAGHTRTELHANIVPLYNSGRGDLAAAPPPPLPVPVLSSAAWALFAIALVVAIRRLPT